MTLTLPARYPIAMLDPILTRLSAPLTGPLAGRLAVLRVRPAAATLAAFVCAVGAVVDIRYGHTLYGLGFLVAARIFDGLDGPLARRAGASERGAYLARVLDLLAAAAVPFAFALAEPDRALAAMFLMLGLVVQAAAGNTTAPADPTIGKTEMFVAYALACVFPDWFSIVAYIVGLACFAGAGYRVATVLVEAP